MYRTIMVPVDLAHSNKLEKALKTAADISKLYGGSMHLVGVTAATPSAVAHNPQEFAQRLEAFSADQSTKLGLPIASKTVASVDPAVDLDESLDHAAEELGADLIVMASHVPGFWAHILSSNAGYLASHSKVSVLVVR